MQYTYLRGSKVKVRVKVKFTLQQETKAQRDRVDGVQYSFFNLSARWGGWSTPRPGRFTPGKIRYPLYWKLGGPRDSLDGMR
jgi:hypothetical protein